MWFTAEPSGVLEMQNFTSALTYSSPDGLTFTPLPLPQSLYGQRSVLRWRDNQIFADG